MDQAHFLTKRGLKTQIRSELCQSLPKGWGYRLTTQTNFSRNLTNFATDTESDDAAGTTQIESSGEPLDPRLARLRTEAILLLSKTALSPRKLAQLAYLADATQARTLVRELNQIYELHHRAIRVEQVAGGYRMFTHPSLAPWLTRLGHLPPSVRISTPMMETLAVVAYHQPVSRANAEAVRGVGCGEILRQLMERDLVRIVGRSEELGRPYLYGTTKRFLQLFGLRSIESLPPIQVEALQDDPLEDSLNQETSTSTKELVVSTTVAPVLAETELAVVDRSADQHDTFNQGDLTSSPTSQLEDEENEYYDDDEDEDEEEDDWSSNDDDDWDDEDVDDEEDEDDDDESDDDLEEESWEEVDDSDDDEDDWGDDEESDDDDWDDDSDDEEDDDEDWD
jgi:segregation and condensation protein B